MRKKINAIVILSLVLSICLLMLVACNPERDENGLLKLATPQNFELSGSTLSWDEVDNAELYYIFAESKDDTAVVEIDGEVSTTTTSFNLSTIVSGYGKFNVYVRAYGDGKTYGTSNKGEYVYDKGFTLDTPRVVIDNAVASWPAVNDAVKYSIRIFSGEDVLLLTTDTQELSFSFADYKDDEGKAIFEEYDKYRFVITAVPADYSKYSDSERGTFYYINSTTLDTPKFSSMTTSRLQWGSVTNASSYTLKMRYVSEDGETTDEITVDTTGTSYQRSNFNYERVGDYYFSIKANGDNEVFMESDFSEEDDAYAVTKLEGIAEGDLNFAYSNDGVARLTWSISADTKADLFYLTLVGLLPDGSSKLENSDTSLTVSCNVVFVKGMVYDFYQYTDADKTSATIDSGKSIVVYNIDGNMKVRYAGQDYSVKSSTTGTDMKYSSYVKSDGVDIVFDGSNFVYVKDIPVDGEAKDQYTGEDEDVIDTATGNQLCYFEESTSDTYVEKSVVFNSAHEPVSFNFAINLDDMFMKVDVEEVDGGAPNTTYEYLKSASNYGILYDISVSAGNSNDKYVSSESSVAGGQYLSYKVALQNQTDGKYYVNNAGEYAYIVLQDFINRQKGSVDTLTYVINGNINFNGYEVTQIQDFYGKIEGGNHTLANMVVGNKQLTSDGVVAVESDTVYYSQFVNIKSGSRIDDTFYVGLKFVGYEKVEEDDSDADGEDNTTDTAVSEIYVAPIAINLESGANLYKVFAQTDSIKADGATVAGMVINNNGLISVSQVYANLEGRVVGGVAVNVAGSIGETGFYGSLNAVLGEYFDEKPSMLASAGIAVNVAENGVIYNCEAVGDINVEGANVDALYAGGLVAINSGSISQSYCGEYTRGANEANIKRVVTNGNNGYTGGLVAHNTATGTIADSYATNRAQGTSYVGGFVGLNEGTITRAYSLGGTVSGGNHNHAFAGSNTGDISYVVAYANVTQSQDAESYLGKLLKDQSDASLNSIMEVLYSDSDANDIRMTVTDEEGFRYPILKGRTYTKNYVVEMGRNQTDPDVSGIAVISGEVKTFTIDSDKSGEYIFGDTGARGNKIVIVLNYSENVDGGNYVKLIYAQIK